MIDLTSPVLTILQKRVVIVLKLSPTAGLPNILGSEMVHLHRVLLLHAGEGR